MPFVYKMCWAGAEPIFMLALDTRTLCKHQPLFSSKRAQAYASNTAVLHKQATILKELMGGTESVMR